MGKGNQQHEFPLETVGRVVRDGGNLRVIYNNDLVGLYKSMIDRHYWLNTTFPKHGAHTTICSSKIHGKIDITKLNKWHGEKIIVKYSPYIHVGAKTKNYRIFMMFCSSMKIDAIVKDLGVTPPWNWHITVCNYGKAENPYNYFPPLITVQNR